MSAFVYKGYRVFWNDHGDADDFCELCFRDIPEEDLASGDGPYDDLFAPHVYDTTYMEVDSPLHCSQCHRPLQCSFTDHGVELVVNRLRESLDKTGTDFYRKLGDFMEYYAGSPSYTIDLDWAEQIAWYGLDGEPDEILQQYLDRVIAVERSTRYRLYWKYQQVMDSTVRPFARFMDGRYQSVISDIESWR